MSMSIDLSQVPHHPALEEMVEVLCTKAQENNRNFFRIMLAYFMGKVASSMRATVVSKDIGEIPVNIYSLAFATSGFGKGRSIYTVENEFLGGFKERFLEDTYKMISEQSLWQIANKKAANEGTNPQEEFDKFLKEFNNFGPYLPEFDSGTSPATKDLRQKLLMGQIGSINMQIDEIGYYLEKEMELLTLFLELYDQGMVKRKLVKNTSDNRRSEERHGKTPANMLLFGTPTKLFDGNTTEKAFYGLLESGYARRCLFGYVKEKSRTSKGKSAEEIFKTLISPSNSQVILKWANRFENLADPSMVNWSMEVPDDVSIARIQYQMECEELADAMSEHEDIRKAEMAHRHFKALKLAGAFAFVDGSSQVLMEHLMSAIKLVEESGEAFKMVLSRDPTYVKLAKFIASTKTEVTHADLTEALPFYRGGKQTRDDMMTLAVSWGYKNNIIVKKSFGDGIEFFTGETLDETDIDKIRISYSDNWAYGYLPEEQPFDQLHVLTQAKDMHWATHHFKNGHRAKENVIPGFNMIVIDVDGTATLDQAHDLLADYKFLTSTTKSHTPESHRFRILLPMNYRLKLDELEYKEFMNSVLAWLPFETDQNANQNSKKWSSFDGGTYHYNLDGDLFDALPFIPKTRRNEEFQQRNQELGSLPSLERWFAQRMGGEGSGRNNQMIKYALILVDSGLSLGDVEMHVKAFNRKMKHPMDDSEIDGSIMVTVAKKVHQRLTQMAA
ncbi:hypothetical protein [Mesorhizobium sp. CN2-181]|uniref:hypothetical protein n=1 Tax=Mesorhizobium yinganensis TaxID=3157707 RepID=UPI0032B7C59F